MQKNSEIEFLEDKNILILKSPLIYRSQDSIEDLQEIMNLIVKYKSPKVLGDFRGLNIDFSLGSNVEKPKQWKQLAVSKNIKIGALFDKLDDRNLMRINTLFSHGFKVCAFNDYDSAIKWQKH
ncbi:MAG: hypothetical protein ACFE94_09075 [Candidatus Hodarchaeota archaeon]